MLRNKYASGVNEDGWLTIPRNLWEFFESLKGFIGQGYSEEKGGVIHIYPYSNISKKKIFPHFREDFSKAILRMKKKRGRILSIQIKMPHDMWARYLHKKHNVVLEGKGNYLELCYPE